MWSISEIKSRGKAAFKANYWSCVLASFILALVTGTSTKSSSGELDTDDFTTIISGLTEQQHMELLAFILGAVGIGIIIGILIKIFLVNPIKVGCYRFFRKNVEAESTSVSTIFSDGFSNFGHVFATLFLRDLFVALWSCLLIIPGLIKIYSYRMVPYIVKDNPELSATEVITRSREMMNGNKWRAFLLDLSFIGWIILGIITCGIVLIFWTNPYMENANAALYVELLNQQNNVAE